MRNGEQIAINGRDYQLDAVLSSGAGSYGEVWAATDVTGRAVAIKLINAEAMNQADPALHGHWRAHLEREITFLRGLDADQSRHVVTLLNHGAVDGQPALVLERLQANLGQWLAQLRRENAPPDLTQILDWAEQILDGLDVVHQAGFVYRDLKFSNLLVGDDGTRLKLADFGSLKRENGDNTRSFIGTPATMAPEQVLPARQGAEGCEYAVDYRADYYALGLLLFTLLTDQPTTTAQRRLSQLLTLYGQEGAGQRGAQLGGLDDEERALLRRSIEFWTVPARPEQGGGTAALLVNLIDRLLAREPVDRPADALEIRAALDLARVAPFAAPTLTPDWSAPPPVTEPPNRHPRRNNSPLSGFRRRWVLLTGAAGLAGAVAWAVVHPVSEIGPDQAEPLRTVIAPPPAKLAKPAEPPSTIPSSPSPTVSDTAPAPPATTVAPVEETPAPPATTDAPVAEAPEPVDAPSPSVVGAPEPAMDVPSPPVVGTPEPAEAVSPPARIAPAQPRLAPKPAAPATKQRAVVATPPSPTPSPVGEPRPAIHAKPSAPFKPAKPAPAVAADRPGVHPHSAPVERAVVMDRPTTTPRIAKPTPPAAPEASRRPLTAAQTRPKPHDSGSSRPAAQTRPTARVASRPPTMPKPVSKPADPVARTEPPSRIASRTEPVPALPPIKLESRSEPAPALPPIKLESRPEPAPAPPPIKLESRPQSAPPNSPPIELVSRSGAAAPTVSRANPKPRPASPSAAPPAQSADPITQFRDDAGRAAAEFGHLVGHASTTVSNEVRRGLEAADQTVGRWTGRCRPADGCQEARVERRDRWTDRHRGNSTAPRESPTRYSEDDGFARPPPRQYRDDYR